MLKNIIPSSGKWRMIKQRSATNTTGAPGSLTPVCYFLAGKKIKKLLWGGFKFTHYTEVSILARTFSGVPQDVKKAKISHSTA